MTQNNFISQAWKGPLAIRMITGAGIGLALISLFLFSADYVDPQWGRFYMVKPLIVVPIAGAMGTLFFHLMDPFRYRGGWQKIVATTISLIVFLVALWLGTVLGLNGTYWN